MNCYFTVTHNSGTHRYCTIILKTEQCSKFVLKVVRPNHNFSNWTALFTICFSVNLSDRFSYKSVRSNFSQSLFDRLALFQTLLKFPSRCFSSFLTCCDSCFDVSLGFQKQIVTLN